MWVARNELVHEDGETRNTLVISDLNQNIKRLQREGARCRDLFWDDRKFFKTPYWKIKKKTEEKKIRYVETATRLLSEARRSTQQTLNLWRQESNESSSSTDSGNDDDTSAQTATPGDIADGGGVQIQNMQQRNLFDYFIKAVTIGSTTSINGMSSDGSEAYNDESSADSYSDMSTQPPAGLAQPQAGPGLAAGLAQPPGGPVFG